MIDDKSLFVKSEGSGNDGADDDNHNGDDDDAYLRSRSSDFPPFLVFDEPEFPCSASGLLRLGLGVKSADIDAAKKQDDGPRLGTP
jgi:hypothetical protein